MFVGFAILLFAIGGFNLMQYRAAMKNHIKVNGVLVDLHNTYSTRSASYGDVEECSIYPVFEYMLEGTVYTEEYRYEAVSGSELVNIVSNMPDGAIKKRMLKFAQTEPEYKIGQSYTILVNKNAPKIFFIENQRAFIKEMKWFIMGGAVLLVRAIFLIVSLVLG